MQRHYWWPGITAYVRHYVQSCTSCQLSKSTNRVQPGQLRPLQIPDSPFASVGMDFITGLPQTRSGHDCILVFVCRLTKMVHFVPTTTTVGGEATASLYRDHVFKLHGLASELVSDRGTQFNNAFMRTLTRLLGTRQALSTAFHPQTDGQTERVNRVLEEMLRHFNSPRQDDWDEYLSLAEFAVNNAKHASTGQSPFFLVYGRNPRTRQQTSSHCLPKAHKRRQRMSSLHASSTALKMPSVRCKAPKTGKNTITTGESLS